MRIRDGAGREYWLIRGRVYAEGHGRSFAICPLARWGRLLKLYTTSGLARRRASGRALRRTLAA